MGEGARILATEAMAEGRSALADFAESVERVLSGVDADIQRTTQWLQHDRPGHWKREVRAREDEVLKAKTAISRKQIIAAPNPASVVDERRALDRAKRRLEEAQRRQEATRRWAATWEREAMVYKGAAFQIRAMVSGQIPATIGRISRMMESVEGYLSMRAPTDDSPPAGPESSAPGGADGGGGAA